MNEQEFYEILGFVLISRHRLNTLKAISEDLKIPTQIAKEIDTRVPQVSSALFDLKKKNLVKCVNESAYKGRLYTCTPKGLEILKSLEKYN